MKSRVFIFINYLAAISRISILIWIVLCLQVNGLQAQRVISSPEQTSAFQLQDTAAIRAAIRAASKLAQTEPDSALLMLEELINNSAAADYPAGVVRALLTVSNIYNNQGKYYEILGALSDAVSYCTNPGEKPFLSQIYNNMGTAYRSLGDYEQAARSYYQAILFAERFGTVHSRGLIYSNLSTILLQLKRSDEALFYLEMAERINKIESNFELSASILMHKGIFHIEQQQWEQGRSLFERGLELARSQTDPRYAAIAKELYVTALANLGQCYREMGQPALALPYLEEAVANAGEVNVYHQNTTTTLLGQVYYDLGNFHKAEPLLLEGLRTASEVHLTNAIMHINHTLAELYAAMGRERESIEAFRNYILMRDSIEGKELKQDIAQLESKYRLSEKDRELARHQLQIVSQERNLQRQRTWILAISSGSLMVVIILLAMYRNKVQQQRLQKEKILTLQQEWELIRLKSLIQGEEKERIRIARELHDGIGGLLAAVNIRIGTFQRRHQGMAGMEEMERISEMLQETAAEVRKSAHNLMPDQLINYGLAEALRLFCDRINAAKQLDIDVQCYGVVEELPQYISLAVYRVVQELVQNIIRHANATTASIQIHVTDRELRLMIEDNGIGFPGTSKGEGLGLKNIEDRISDLDGQMHIDSAGGNGTIVYVTLNLQKLKSPIN